MPCFGNASVLQGYRKSHSQSKDLQQTGQGTKVWSHSKKRIAAFGIPIVVKEFTEERSFQRGVVSMADLLQVSRRQRANMRHVWASWAIMPVGSLHTSFREAGSRTLLGIPTTQVDLPVLFCVGNQLYRQATAMLWHCGLWTWQFNCLAASGYPTQRVPNTETNTTDPSDSAALFMRCCHRCSIGTGLHDHLCGVDDEGRLSEIFVDALWGTWEHQPRVGIWNGAL